MKNMKISPYNPSTDYEQVAALYRLPNSFGGQFDDARDTKARLDGLVTRKPNTILVAERGERIVGTVTLFEDGRSAWLYRFAIQPDGEQEIAAALWSEAKRVMKELGHTQVLVYAPAGDEHFLKRYTSLGFIKGGDYTAYWQDLDPLS